MATLAAVVYTEEEVDHILAAVEPINEKDTL